MTKNIWGLCPSCDRWFFARGGSAPCPGCGSAAVEQFDVNAAREIAGAGAV